MAEKQDTHVESKDSQYYSEDLENLSDEEAANDVIFTNSKGIVDIARESREIAVEAIFNDIISGQIDLDSLKEKEKISTQEAITRYIQKPSNKSVVLDKYIQYGKNFSNRIGDTIEEMYSPSEIGEYEVESYFESHKIVSVGREINGKDWDGSNIDQSNPKISEICVGSFFTVEQFVQEFNYLNDNRKTWNINMMKNVNFDNFNIGDIDIHKRQGKLYLGDELLTDESMLSNQQILNYIKKFDNFNYVSDDEFKNDLKFIEKDQINIFKKRLDDELQDEDESYNIPEHEPEHEPVHETNHIIESNNSRKEKLTKRRGVFKGPSGRETYYNLNMSGVVKIMRHMGYTEDKGFNYHIRSDGVKMLGDYIMVAANLKIRPRGTILETSLGKGIVCDTGSFVKKYPTGLDIATNWR